MAINPSTQYPGKIAAPSAGYPYGAARNITLPGDGTGTPWDAALANDILGFQQAMLSRAGIVPSGTPEQVGGSQYLRAMDEMFIPKVTVAEAKAIEWTAGDKMQIIDRGFSRWEAVATGGTPDEYGLLAGTGVDIQIVETGVMYLLPWFGTVGDGVADDYGAIAACVAYVVSKNGGIIYAPAGKYRHTQKIILSSYYGAPTIILKGAGHGPWNQDTPGTFAYPSTEFVADFDGDNAFEITSTGQIAVSDIAISDGVVGSRTAGAGIYCERDGGGVVPDAGNVTGVRVQQVAVRGFQDGVRAVRLQTSTLEQLFVEDCVRDGIRLETTAAGGGTSVTLKNCFVKECGNDNFHLAGYAYTTFNNCASDAPGRHGYFLDGTVRNNTSIAFIACGCEVATTDGVHLTAGNFGITLTSCIMGPCGGDGLHSEADNVVVLGGKYLQCTGYGVNMAGGNSLTLIGPDFAANTAGDTNSNDKMIQINADANAILLGHNVVTGANTSEIVLRNSAGLRSLNNAGTTSANYQIRGTSADDWLHGVPVDTAKHILAWSGTNQVQWELINSGPVLRMLNELTSDPASPAANQARVFLRDNGAGKTQLAVRFGTGAVQILATEP